MADVEIDLEYELAAEIMLPYAAAAEKRIKESNIRFVHYTTAQSALEILKSNCIWMRNATCMNDYNEMRYGLRCLVAAFETESGNAFNVAMDDCHSGLAKELDEKFSRAAPALIEHTYLTCVSEHSDDEEAYGRLSMWQSYGSKTGAALVFNNGPFLRASDALPIWVSPVSYIDAKGVKNFVQTIADRMVQGRDLLSQLPREDFLDLAFRTLISAVVSCKHEGFREEKEWRIVHLPTIWPAPSARLPLDQVSLDGIPQPIFKIPFVDYPDEGFFGVTIPELISRIIVGPTQYPAAIQMAMAHVLGDAGVNKPMDYIRCSDVTLRM